MSRNESGYLGCYCENGNLYIFWVNQKKTDGGTWVELYRQNLFKNNRVSYDENDNVVKMEYANEDVIDYEYYQYNEDSLLKSVSLNGEKNFEYQYEENRFVKVEDFLNGTSYEMAYDEENNLTSYKAGGGLEKQVSYLEETDTYTESNIYDREEVSCIL